MSRSSGPWVCIVLVAVGFILATTVLPQPDPNSPPSTQRSPFARGGRGGGGRFSTYGNSSAQQQRSPFPMRGAGGRGMFPFFQPPPPPPAQHQPPPNAQQSNVEEESAAAARQQQQQQRDGQQAAAPATPDVQTEEATVQPTSQPQPTGAAASQAAPTQSSTGVESVEERMVADIPTVILALLYGGIGASLLALAACRMYAWCCPPRSLYSPTLSYYPPASSSPLISPLSLYQYKPAVSSTATTASLSSHRFTPPGSNGYASSPLAMSLPNERSYASMGERAERGEQAGKQAQSGGQDESDGDSDRLVWAYSV